MPQGMQVRDASGNLVQDVTDKVSRLLGHVDTTTAAGSITDNRLLEGSPWPQIQGADFNSVGKAVTFSGNTMSWTASNWSGRIRYWID